MFEKLKEYWVEIISWIIGIAGIIATIVSLYISESEGMFVLYVLLLAFETILVLFGSLGLKYKYSFESEIDDLKDEIAEMGIAQSEMQEENKRKLLESQKCIGTVFSNLKNISKLHNDLCNRITVINENSYRILEVLEAAFTEDSASVKTEAVQAQVLSSYKDFANGMFDLYKRYTNQMLTCLVNMVEAYLKLRGHNQKVAATVKLFDEAFYESCGRREDITVYTAF